MQAEEKSAPVILCEPAIFASCLVKNVMMLLRCAAAEGQSGADPIRRHSRWHEAHVDSHLPRGSNGLLALSGLCSGRLPLRTGHATLNLSFHRRGIAAKTGQSAPRIIFLS